MPTFHDIHNIYLRNPIMSPEYIPCMMPETNTEKILTRTLTTHEIRVSVLLLRIMISLLICCNIGFAECLGFRPL